MKYFKISLAALMALLLTVCACGESAGLANPVVPVRDDDAFEDTLGIDVDVDDLAQKPLEMSIIGNTLGQIVFHTQNVNGEDVEWCLRFTKDAALAADYSAFSGIYDAQMGDSVSQTYDWIEPNDNDPDKATFELITVLAPSENAEMKFWTLGKTYYCLTLIGGSVSQMQMAAVLDNVFEAVLD